VAKDLDGLALEEEAAAAVVADLVDRAGLVAPRVVARWED